MLVNPTDYFLYLPLLPDVAGGLLDPRRVTVSIPGTLPEVRLVLGSVEGVDLRTGRMPYLGPEGRRGELGYDRLLLTTGSINKLLPVPGVAQYAHDFCDIAEALYLRDHVTRQIELADRPRRPGGAGGAHDVRGGRRRLHGYGGGGSGCAPDRCLGSAAPRLVGGAYGGCGAALRALVQDALLPFLSEESVLPGRAGRESQMVCR